MTQNFRQSILSEKDNKGQVLADEIIRDRPKFGFGFGFGTKDNNLNCFGKKFRGFTLQ